MDWTHETAFGSQGSEPSQLLAPESVVASADGLIVFVADTGNSRMSVWTKRGATSSEWVNQTTFGDYGDAAGEFRSPTGVALSGNETTALVADAFNDRVSVWTRRSATSTDWTNQSTFGSGPDWSDPDTIGSGADDANQFWSPAGVAVSADSLTALVADKLNDRISVWTRNSGGRPKWTNQTAFGSDGSGRWELTFPEDVIVSRDGLTAWVADSDNDRISVWRRSNSKSTDWAVEATFGSEGNGARQFRSPSGLAASGDGLTVWVADSNNSRISVWIWS
jgi:DNA-binding beta-propeller fold protein YncE